MSNIKSTTTTAAESIALDDLAHDVELLRIIEDQIDRLKSLKSGLRSTVTDRLGDAEVGTINGVPVITYKTTLRVITVMKLLKQRYPDAVRECEDIIPVRTFKFLDAA